MKTHSPARHVLALALVGAATLLPALASAQEVVAMQPAPPPPEATRHSVSVTFSPFHLILPVFEASAEFRLHPRISVAGIVGGGSLKITTGASSTNFGVYELGAQGRFYFLGDFEHGLHVGIEALYVGVSASGGSTAILADGLSLGPLLGYKIAARFGLTFEAQGGVAYLTARASSGSSTASASEWGPIVNINVGWSF